MLTLNNPAGLWALLGIPAVLAIHYLQRQAVILPVSTLFLLEKTQRESASGRRFDRLVPSVPLWMQLLGVLLLTWLLTEPRYRKARSTQRVAVVLDSSASMMVSKDRLRDELIAALPALKGPASELELIVLEGRPGRQRLFTGSDPAELAAAMDGWKPRDGLADPSPVLRLARSLVSREGVVILATDTPVTRPPFDARVLSAGEPLENCGFTGVSVVEKEGAAVFQALVRNYGKSRTSRTWWVERPGGDGSTPREITLEPGAIAVLQSALPTDSPRLVVRLSADEFPLDDVMPLVIPAPKSLTLFPATGGEYARLTERLAKSLQGTETGTDAAGADLTLLSYDPLDPVLPEGNAIMFLRDDTRGGAYLKGGIVAEKHPLIDELNWQALLVRETIQLERTEEDSVLLWQGTRPLIFLRERPGSRQLCFNFDLRLSNATTQPAFIVMLHRFVAELREAKVGEERTLLECGQIVTLAAQTREGAAPLEMVASGPDGAKTSAKSLPAAARVRFEAPADPGFIEVRQGDQVLLAAGVHFADTREADFTACGPENTTAEGSAAAVERHTEEDHWWRAWVLLLLAALLISWHFSRERSALKSAAATSSSDPLPAP